MASKKPDFLKPRKTVKRTQSSSSSSSSSAAAEIYDPTQHALHLEEHFVETRSKITQASAVIKDCLTFAKTVESDLEKINEKQQNDPEVKKLFPKVRQLVLTVTMMAEKISELERANTENQTSFEIFKSSTFEYILSTTYNDVELMSQFEHDIKPEKIKTEDGLGDDYKNETDDDEDGLNKSKKNLLRRALLPAECR
jgi:hypothetical protein